MSVQEDSNEEAALSVSASSIRITDVTEDGDVLTFAITSQKVRRLVNVKACFRYVLWNVTISLKCFPSVEQQCWGLCFSNI